jgi:hypothetical protein
MLMPISALTTDASHAAMVQGVAPGLGAAAAAAVGLRLHERLL